jgi:hypothetical protein
MKYQKYIFYLNPCPPLCIDNIEECKHILQGKAEYTMEYSRYAPCDGQTQDQLISLYQQEQDLLEAASGGAGGKKKKK